MDAAQDRVTARSSVDFDTMVESVRVGTVFAHDASAYARWRSKHRPGRKRERGLTGAALEDAVMRVAGMFPGNVVRGAA